MAQRFHVGQDKEGNWVQGRCQAKEGGRGCPYSNDSSAQHFTDPQEAQDFLESKLAEANPPSFIKRMQEKKVRKAKFAERDLRDRTNKILDSLGARSGLTDVVVVDDELVVAGPSSNNNNYDVRIPVSDLTGDNASDLIRARVIAGMVESDRKSGLSGGEVPLSATMSKEELDDFYRETAREALMAQTGREHNKAIGDYWKNVYGRRLSHYTMTSFREASYGVDFRQWDRSDFERAVYCAERYNDWVSSKPLEAQTVEDLRSMDGFSLQRFSAQYGAGLVEQPWDVTEDQVEAFAAIAETNFGQEMPIVAQSHEKAVRYVEALGDFSPGTDIFLESRTRLSDEYANELRERGWSVRRYGMDTIAGRITGWAVSKPLS